MDCIVCKKPLEDYHPVTMDVDIELPRCRATNHPFGGSEFVTYGHYGSRVTDTFGAYVHVVNVCDDCLLEALADGRAFKEKP